jgi:uncharacterized protein
LLLRGPQTPGELRGRTERMYRFEALEDIVATLDRLAQREPPLVAVLPRQPGTKESRYMHLFSGEPSQGTRSGMENQDVSKNLSPVDAGEGSMTDRITKLEQEVSSLRAELSEVSRQLAAFRKQFD